MGLLDDVRVLDATQMIAGPLAAMHLGDLGATVVKVERPDGGELTRDFGPFVEGTSGYFASLNRNKECVTLDLATEEGSELFLELAAKSDVVLENFKPGTPGKFGIDYESVRSVNPDVVYCAIKGFGEESPYADDPAFDMVIQAMGGAMSITGEPDGSPVRSNVPMGDIAPAMFAVQSIMAALYDRDVNGNGGDRLEVSMLDAMVSWLGPRAARSVITGEPYPRTGSAHNEFAPYRRFRTADSHIVVCVASESLWPRFCETVGREDLTDDPRFDTNAKRSANQNELYALLEPLFEERTTDEWFDRLRRHGVPAGPVNDTVELWDDPHVQRRELLQWLDVEGVDESLPAVAYPVRFGRGLDDPSPPQRLGEATERYLSELGYGEEEIEQLRERDVI